LFAIQRFEPSACPDLGKAMSKGRGKLLEDLNGLIPVTPEAMNQYCNLPPEQRLVQRLVTLFNADEHLWQRLEGKRRLRRRILPRLSPKLLRQLDLLDFARARSPQACVGRTERR
jgi:hypothetical protein